MDTTARHSRARSRKEKGTPLGLLFLYTVAACSAGAGVIHLRAVGEHTDHRLMVAGFLVFAAFQLGFAGMLFTRPSRRLVGAGALATLSIILIWVTSRATGIGFISGAEARQPIEATDLAATMLEVGVVAVAALYLLLPDEALGMRLAELSGKRAMTAVALVVALLLVPGLAVPHDHSSRHHDGDIHGHTLASDHHADEDHQTGEGHHHDGAGHPHGHQGLTQAAAPHGVHPHAGAGSHHHDPVRVAPGSQQAAAHQHSSHQAHDAASHGTHQNTGGHTHVADGSHDGHGEHGSHGDQADHGHRDHAEHEGGHGHGDDGHHNHYAGCSDDHPVTRTLVEQVKYSITFLYPDVATLIAHGYIPYFDALLPGLGFPPGSEGITHWLNPNYIDNGTMLDPFRPEAILTDQWYRPIGVMFIADDGVSGPPVYKNDDGTACSPWHPHTDMPARFGWWFYQSIYGDDGPATELPEVTPEMMHVWGVHNPHGVYAAHDYPPPESRQGPPGPIPSYFRGLADYLPNSGGGDEDHRDHAEDDEHADHGPGDHEGHGHADFEYRTVSCPPFTTPRISQNNGRTECVVVDGDPLSLVFEPGTDYISYEPYQSDTKDGNTPYDRGPAIRYHNGEYGDAHHHYNGYGCWDPADPSDAERSKQGEAELQRSLWEALEPWSGDNFSFFQALLDGWYFYPVPASKSLHMVHWDRGGDGYRAESNHVESFMIAMTDEGWQPLNGMFMLGNEKDAAPTASDAPPLMGARPGGYGDGRLDYKRIPFDHLPWWQSPYGSGLVCHLPWHDHVEHEGLATSFDAENPDQSAWMAHVSLYASHGYPWGAPGSDGAEPHAYWEPYRWVPAACNPSGPCL